MQDNKQVICRLCKRPIEDEVIAGDRICDECDRREQFQYMDDEDNLCHYCGGEGWGIVGTDCDSGDPINGPYDGETEKCPCCHGSGKAKDCTFW